MARIGIPGKSKKPNDKNVLITRTPKNSSNSRGSRYSNNSWNSRGLGSSSNSRSSRSSRGLGSSSNSRSSRSSIWSRNAGPKKSRSPKQVLLMIIILIAFICGLAIGISMITGIGQPDPSDPGYVEYMNVTDNITQYENSSFDLEDENGTQISYYDFEENVTEGQNITAFNASSSANIY